MNLSQLKYFKIVAETGKIKLAAEALFISAPALSSAISSLEEELGAKLFTREGNRIFMNKQGKIFYKYVTRVFDELNLARLEILQSMQEDFHGVHVAMTTSNIWDSLILGFTTAYPEVMLSCSTLKLSQLPYLDTNELHSFVLAEKTDMPSPVWEYDALFAETPIVFLGHDHPLAEKEFITPEDLVDEVLYLPMSNQSLNGRIRMLFENAGITLHRTYEYALNVRLALVEQNKGVSFGTTRSIAPAHFGVCTRPLKAPDCVWEQCIFRNINYKLSSEEELFHDYAIQYFKDNK